MRSSTTEADTRPTVAIVGDSITEQGESALNQTLSHDWRLSIDGRSGHTVAEQLPAARSLGERAPSQVIVNLGTNDVLKRDDLTQSAADLAEVVAAFPGATCIHLVTVNEGIELGGRSFADRSAELNRSISALAAADPRIDVVDWSAAVAAYEAGDQADGPILTDTVHPSPRGQLALAARYAEALAACPTQG
jgi:lysophospholipase L1-like esterase